MREKQQNEDLGLIPWHLSIQGLAGQRGNGEKAGI